MRIPSLFSRWLLPNMYYEGQFIVDEEQCYSLCTIEFDDQGELWNHEQATKALKHIQKKCRGSHEVIVITFIHGWMHNAAPENRNFELFHSLIRKRAKDEAEFARQTNRDPRQIIGVYLAWRGLLWNIPIFKYFTFWSRKAAALRVGNLSCTETLFRIIRAVKSKNNKSLCMFVGHSFGGLILERAIVQALLGAILQKEDGPVDSPTDLIVLVNPACEASIAKQFADILQRNEVIVKKGEATEKDNLPFPLLVSITSVCDKATKCAFPLGQFFVNALKSFRKYDDPRPGLPSQRYLHCHTAGHVPYFYNFQIQPISGKEINKEKLMFSGNNGEEKYQIVQLASGFNCLPFWLMQVPKEIIPNHSNIFTEAFENMLSALLHWTMITVEPTRLDCNSPEQG